MEPEAITSRFNVSSAEIQKYDWQSIIAASQEQQCYRYYDDLFKRSAELATAGDEVGKHVFALLGTVCSFHPNYDSTVNPYQPLWRSGDQRALMAEDLADGDLQALQEILGEVQDAEMRARISDILWECRRDHRAARIAVAAFIESARHLQDGEPWPPFAERLERALQLAAKLGYGKELYQQTVETVEEFISRKLGDLGSGLLCARLMATLISFKAGDPDRYSAAAEKFARELAKNSEWDFAEEYWWVASRWHRRAKREEDARRAEIEAAETMVNKAEANLAGPTQSYSFAAHWLGRAFEAMRQAKASRERTEALHVRFLEVQELSTQELKTMELKYDELPGLAQKLDEAAKTVTEQVKGKSFADAVFKLAFIAQPTDPKTLLKRVKEHANEFVFSAIMPANAITRTGKIADTSPAMTLGSQAETEKAETKNMFLQARQVDWPLRVAAQIEPARQQIEREHPIRLNDLRWLLTFNAFIPPGHAGIYARGLQAGFRGDWLIAMHLLIPQLEASIRAVFQQRKIPTSTVENGIQQERDLGWLLNHSKAGEMFGADIVFDLRGLLTEDFGWNLRNDQAHGLIPESGFYSEASELVWWLVLRLCCLGHRAAQRQIQQTHEAA